MANAGCTHRLMTDQYKALELFKGLANFGPLTAVSPVGPYQSSRTDPLQVLRWGDDHPPRDRFHCGDRSEWFWEEQYSRWRPVLPRSGQ